MPSLFRYFVVVGSVLLGLLWLVDYLVAPATTPAVAAAAPPKITVRHDARASIIERWRTEQAARKAAERGEPVIAAAPEPAVSEPSPTQPEPPQMVAPVSLQTAPAPEPDAAAVRKAEQIQAAQARKARIARERALARRQQDEARQQNEIFFGAQRRAFADAPVFAPFGGRTW